MDRLQKILLNKSQKDVCASDHRQNPDTKTTPSDKPLQSQQSGHICTNTSDKIAQTILVNIHVEMLAKIASRNVTSFQD